jgi:hypothetical protein
MNRLKIPGTIVVLLVLAGVFLLRGFAAGPAHASATSTCAWTLVPSQNPSTSTTVYASVAVASKDVWMVGSFINHGTSGPFLQTLVERWNGTAWQVVASPNPGAEYNALLGVAHIPGGGLWAVGYMSNSTNGARLDQTLIEHWNGKSWRVVTSPDVGQDNNDLYGVVALSSTDAWAVGSYGSPGTSNPGQTLIEHWDGTQWSVVSSQSPGSYDNGLGGIAIVSPTSVWAVGSTSNIGPTQTLIEHWNGTQWSVVSSPDPGSSVDALSGVAALGINNAWAVGYYVVGNNPGQTLTLHWNGTAWKVVSSPNDGSDNNFLDTVTRIPGTSQVWAMGSHFVTGTDQEASLALFRC